MRHPLRIWVVALLVGLIIVALVKVQHVRAERVSHEVARMTERMKTVCVGRFLIDMPASAQIELKRPNIDGFEMVVLNETTEQFQTRLTDREAQLKAEPDHAGGSGKLETARKINTDHGLVGKVLHIVAR